MLANRLNLAVAVWCGLIAVGLSIHNYEIGFIVCAALSAINVLVAFRDAN